MMEGEGEEKEGEWGRWKREKEREWEGEWGCPLCQPVDAGSAGQTCSPALY